MCGCVLFSSNDEILQSYLQKISRYPVLSADEERECAKLARQGNKLAKKRLIQANLRLVVNIARKHIHNSNLPLVDLIQEGNMGIMAALDKFDYKLGYKFSTYATWWVKQAMFKAISEQGHTMRVPVYVQETLSKYKKVKSQLERKYACEVTKGEVAKEMNVAEDKIDNFLNAYTKALSLESHVEAGNESSMSFADIIQDPKCDTESFIENIELKKDVLAALSCLKEREKDVITMRFGLEDDNRKTLEEIGNIYGVTKECIRQMEKRAISKINSSTYCKDVLTAYV